MKESIEDLNDSLVEDFNDLNNKTISFDTFDKFLNNLCIESYHNHVEISGYCGTIPCYCFNCLADAIDSYIQHCLNSGELILEGFSIYDEGYWYALYDKFGYPPDEDEEKENEDTDE